MIGRVWHGTRYCGFRSRILSTLWYQFLEVPEGRTSDSIEIGKSRVVIVSGDQRLLLGQPDHDVIVSLAWGMDQLELDPGFFRFQRIGKDLSRSDKAELAVGLHSDKGSNTHVEHLTRGEKVAVHPR